MSTACGKVFCPSGHRGGHDVFSFPIYQLHGDLRTLNLCRQNDDQEQRGTFFTHGFGQRSEGEKTFWHYGP